MWTLEESKKAGLVEEASGPHINTSQGSQILQRTDTTKVLWIPTNPSTEIVLQIGREGEGEWLTATLTGRQWEVVRDYWDDEIGSEAETILQTPDRLTALKYLMGQFLQ
ncbi:hypothetical protein [Deinococcus radiophilus]|uniref:Uncharacterized protein n=1 Tax=Deinococcus radiophilus TaxID=32062 RepID=A0A3S0I1X9_9DEIO|nr:hypothetical protein [Deinococcus radiophilus]RTR21391.1 hypothetical protein EJ104_13040 [Deinococcus radiophilus]UFA52074.1 hypothetical protein LMT64_14145 [Deinococcus radiophilus]